MTKKERQDIEYIKHVLIIKYRALSNYNGEISILKEIKANPNLDLEYRLNGLLCEKKQVNKDIERLENTLLTKLEKKTENGILTKKEGNEYILDIKGMSQKEIYDKIKQELKKVNNDKS